MATKKSKTIVTPGTKVSQSTINDIKRMGMTEALKLAGKNGKTAGGLASEFQEGVRRMYGARRLEAAKTKYAPVAAKPSTASRPPVAKPKASTASRPPVAAKATTTKPALAAKKSGTTDPLAKFVFSIGKALKGGDRMTAAEVALENKRRIAAEKRYRERNSNK